MRITDLLDAYAAQRLSAQSRGQATFRSLKTLLAPVLYEEADHLTVAIIDRLVAEKFRSAPVHAERALAYLAPMLAWAAIEECIGRNPLDGHARAAQRPPRDRVLNLADLRRIWRAAEPLGYPFGLAIRLLVIVPATREAVGGMRVSNLAVEGSGYVWTQGAPMGTTRLYSSAADLVRSALGGRPAGSDFLFSTTGSTAVSGWSKAKRRLDETLGSEPAGPLEAWRLNDLRASFAMVATEQLSLDRWVVERCLGRVTAFWSPLLREWGQSDELRHEADRALEDWAALISS